MTNDLKLPRSNRAAEFTLPVQLMESGELGKVFAYMEFTPIKVECVNYGGVYEIVGLSPMFDEVPEGNIWPRVTLEIERNEGTGTIFNVKVIK